MKLNKLYILSLLMLSLVIFSCKKDHPISGQQDKIYPITFNVGGFNQSTGGFETNAVSTSALSDQVQYAYYVSYDASGNVVHYSEQRAGATNFGTFKDSLKNGTYTIVFLASKSASIIGAGVNLSTATARLFDAKPSSDLFYKKIALTVSNGKVSQNVSLDRIVAKIQVNIQDQIPGNAYYFQVQFRDSYILKFSTSTPNPDQFNNITLFTLTSAQKGASNVNFSVLALNTITPISLDISCLDQNKNIIARKVISDVNCRANKTTVVIGKLFGSSSGTNNSFTSKVDTAWNPSNINIPF